MSTIKYRYKIWIILFFLTLNIGVLGVNAQSTEQSSISFDWSEETYSFSFEQIWDGTPMILNYSGSYTDEYTSYIDEFNYSEGIYTREKITTTYIANYSHFMNLTRTGSIALDYSVNVFKVDVSIGDVGKLVWMALKSGTLDVEYFNTGEGYNVESFEEYHKVVNRTYQEYNITDYEVVILNTQSGIEEDIFGYSNYSSSQPYQPDYEYYTKHSEVSTPIILTMQIYNTEMGEKIAWANMFQDFIIYNDEDDDGIYSAGDVSQLYSSPILRMSDEYRGTFTPLAEHFNDYVEYEDYNYSVIEIYPKDKTINEIASTIEFTPPSTINGSDISWGITYPDFPIKSYVRGVGGRNGYERLHNASYAYTSPGNFSYLFDYIIDETQADLDFTLDMPKISNDSFYEAVQGYSLALPQYNYFLSTFDIKEKDERELTVPADIFFFESNDTIVAEFNMFDKKNYTIYDYPVSSEDITTEAMGGSISPLLMGALELGANPSNFFVNLMYSIREIVEADTSFNIQDDLYRLETQNYPIWSGEKFTHDPTLSIFYEDYTSSDEGNGAISGFYSGIIIGVVVVITTISIRQRRKRIR